jgi:phosphoserine phosphatase RsbU/P
VLLMDTVQQDQIARELDQRLVELHSLFEMSQLLNSSLNLRVILSNLLLTPMGRMMVSRCVVMVTSEKNDFEIVELRGLGRSLIGKKYRWDCELTKPISLRDSEAPPVCLAPFFKELDMELIIPIVSTQRVVGLMGLGPKLDRNPFSSTEIEYLFSLSNIAAKSIENALIVQKLEQVNRQLDKKIQELNTLFEIGKELNATLDKEKIVNLLIYAVMGELLVNRCFVFLKENDQLRLSVARGMQTETDQTKAFSKPGFLKSLSRIKESICLTGKTIPRNLKLLQVENIQVVVPMQMQDKEKGYILLGEKITKQPFQEEDLEFLSTLANQAIISLENATMFDQMLEKQRMEEELNIARDIQQRLLPSEYPHTDQIEIQGINIPSYQVGGDYLDWIRLDEARIAVTVADVSGKGIPASLLMSSLQAGLRNSVTAYTEMGEMVGRLNNFIQANTTYDKFITFFYAVIDLHRHELTFVNAGHNPPYLYHIDGTVKRLETGGIILGMMADMPYETETVPLRTGDLLLMFTDGVTEAKDIHDQDFEEFRLEEIATRSGELTVKVLLDEIVYAIKTFTKGAPQSDDITLMAVRLL